MWADAVGPGWEMQHRQLAPVASQLRELDSADLDSMELPDLAKHLVASVHVRGAAGSLDLAKFILNRDSMHGMANLVCASAVVKMDRAKAREHLEIAARDPETRYRAYQALSQMAEEDGRENEAAKYFDLAEKEEAVEEDFIKEIYEVPPTAAYRPTKIEGDMAPIIEAFAKQEAITEVHLVEFDSRIRPGSVHQIFMIEVKYPTFVMDEDTFVAKVIEGLHSVAYNCKIIRPKETAYKKAMDKLPEALVYSRQST
jgi:hypothetical protein